ncbi:MAG: RDD family protein, partial [Chloroflexi bacterium]|nr:RDD family protein [Chloroflexota bacterium]
MKCQACGRTNPKNASSCLGCGASLSAAAATQPPPSSTTQPAPPYTEPAAPTTVSGPASFWQRLVAYLIDSALLGVLSYLVTTVALSLTLGPG